MTALEKSIPWCTVFLAGASMLFHVGTLIGNMETSEAIAKMGSSVDGWADVGVALADALVDDLDELMSNVTDQLTVAINQTMEVQEAIDTVLGLMGEGASETLLTQMSLLETGSRAVAEAEDDPLGAIIKVVMKAMSSLPNFQQAVEKLTEMIESIKPSLYQVGRWVETFSDKVQASVEAFGTTLDRVQKIFDSIMSKASPDAGAGEDLMIHDTYNLFDVDGSGDITVDDMRNCADLYAINALEGDKASELLNNYDANSDGVVDKEEFMELVEDETIVGIMATVLRAYAIRLSKVAGQVGSSKMRSEVALNVVGYFQLVCSKNLTKVGWVSDRLTNASVPMAFTADVLAQLALTKDDPNVLTTADVGEIVVGMMMETNSDYTLQALDLMGTPEHWTSEGFNPEDQANAVSQVTQWTISGPDALDALESTMVAMFGEEEARTFSNDEVVHKVPLAAKEVTRAKMNNFLHERRQKRSRRRLELYPTEESELFMIELLHGVAATDGPVDRAQQALQKGIPAVPETLEFAKFLSWNATRTADRFQEQCFNYTGESSSALDAFNTQVQGMVKKISGFIDMMKQYSTPEGIDKLEVQVEEFASKAMADVTNMVKKKVLEVVQNTFDKIDPTGGESNESGDLLRVKSDAVHAVLPTAFMLVEETNISARVPLVYHDTHQWHCLQRREAAPPQLTRVHRQLGKAASRALQDPGTDVVPSGIWDQVVTMLRAMEQILPTATDLLRFARKEVSAVSEGIRSLFGTLKGNGKKIFLQSADAYKMVWFGYFFFVFPMSFCFLLYGFWASGYFGGPQPVKKQEEDYEPPSGFWNRMKHCCGRCCDCMTNCHDTQSCFWSFIVFFQLIVLLLFLISIVFVILAGVNFFLGTSCGQIYLLNDTKVCTETLAQLQEFLASFEVNEGEVPLTMACEHYDLKTCETIKTELLIAAITQVGCSFLATFFTFELVFNSASLHERVAMRRLYNEMLAEDKA